MTDAPNLPAFTNPPKRSAITPMEMLQIAVERNADLDQLQKLMDLQERWERNEARKAYVAALTAFKRSPPSVVKNRRAAFGSRSGGAGTEYEYATLAQVAGIIAPALSQHGLSHNWSLRQDERGIAVTCTLTHEMGHSENITMQAPADSSGSKNSIQALGSTVTYLERYTLLAITGLATIDQDDDATGVVQMISPEQKDKIVDLLKETNADTEKFIRYFNIPYVDALPAKQFQSAVEAIEKKRQKP